MGGGEAFFDIITVTGFTCAIYFAGLIAMKLKMSPIIGEIAAGVVLGPDVANLLKSEHADFLSLLGQFGVTLMIFESGMHVDFSKLRLVFKDALIVAVLGTALPIVTGIAYAAAAFGKDRVYPDGLAMGCSMAPTSVGIALKLLTESKMLSSLTGQTIVTAAFVDDIFSILALVILLNLAKGDITPVNIIVPVVLSFVFVVGGAALALKFWPPLMKRIMDMPIFKADPTASFQLSHKVHLLIMFCVLIGYGTAAHFVGSHLLGAFMGGMSFAAVPRSNGVWGRQMKRIAKWLIRLFFACTVAFSIPISSMMSLDAFWKGLICGAGPCIGAKLLSGLHTGSKRWLVGFAMAGRGEFAFLVAETSKTTVMGGDDGSNSTIGSLSGSATGEMLLSKEAYSITVWALLCATIIAPFGFKYFLAKEAEKKPESTGIYSFKLKLKSEHYGGIAHDVQEALHAMQLFAENVAVDTDGVVSMQTMIVQTSDGDFLDDEKFATIRSHLFEVLNDPDGQIAIEPIFSKVPVDVEGSVSAAGSELPSNSVSGLALKQNMVPQTMFRPASFLADVGVGTGPAAKDPDRYYMVVKVMSQHHTGFLEKTLSFLQKEDLQVCKAKVYLIDHCPKAPPPAGQEQTAGPAISYKTFYCLDVGEGTGAPAPQRLQTLRDHLRDHFTYSDQASDRQGMDARMGKALIKTMRVDNAPTIFGFTPKDDCSTTAFINFEYEQRPNHSVLKRVLDTCRKSGLNTLNLAVDQVDGEKSREHKLQQATLFAAVSGKPDEKDLAGKLKAVFVEENVPMRLHVQLSRDAAGHTEEFGSMQASPRVSRSSTARTCNTSISQGREDDDEQRRN